MKKHNKAAILDYWRAIELFSPQNIPHAKPNDQSEPVYSFLNNELLPWDDSHPLKRKFPPKNTSRRFQVYGGIFNLATVKTILEDKFGKDLESFDERSDGENCLFSFFVADDGRPLFDTFVLSTCAWATSRTIEPGPNSSTWLEGFESTEKKIHNSFSERYAVQQNDERGIELKNKGFELGRPIGYDEILKVVQLTVGDLGIPNLLERFEIRIKATLVASKKKYSTDDQDFLNSFFVRDIGKVAAEIRNGNFGNGLSNFLASNNELESSKRIDTRTSFNTLFEHLSPSLFPAGRWPSKGHHPLVFSQQFAVNSIAQQLMNNTGTFAVNGPPGTGKTTLLRDLVASVVVERAKRIAELHSPKQAFSGEKRWKSGKFNRVISLWKDEFKGFEIVVASNNNGAVENITLEIPGKNAIDPSWLNITDYFPEIASRLIEQPAWAMVAAKLGNKTNRSKFVSQFWFGQQEEAEDNDEPANGFLKILRDYETQQVDWKQAVNAFKKAVADEDIIREERIAIHKAYMDYFSLFQNIPSLEKNLAELEAERDQSIKQLQDLGSRENELAKMVDNAKKQRLENHLLRPDFLTIILSLGKAFREWRKEDNQLKCKIEIAEHHLRNGVEMRLTSQRDVQLLDNKIDHFFSQISHKRQLLETTRSKLIKARAQLGRAFPMPDNWGKDEEERELSSPWSDARWDTARANVFLAALDLHKAFIAANADIMRKNLQASMDVLSGSIPDDASPEGIASAWTTLFFVIPTISTTFASFDRLFAHLGREAIGWLLIDEAGQAAPQVAVGAIWRSKRTVVVGDPLQLEPVVTIPFTVQQALRRHFKVEETWLPGTTSVQQLADRVNQLGTYVNRDDGPLWVGSPLRVHRRCDKKMFDISNKIAYDGLMVFGTGDRDPIQIPESTWLDVDSHEADGHWIPAEGREVEKLIGDLVELGVATNEIFLISPFRSVVRNLRKITETFSEVKVGTIHTAQGKESDVVILVLGGNPSKPGAKQWASERPNLLNVAASRAKRRLYVIGNREAWRQYKYFSVCAAIIGNKKGIEP